MMQALALARGGYLAKDQVVRVRECALLTMQNQPSGGMGFHKKGARAWSVVEMRDVEVVQSSSELQPKVITRSTETTTWNQRGLSTRAIAKIATTNEPESCVAHQLT